MTRVNLTVVLAVLFVLVAAVAAEALGKYGKLLDEYRPKRLSAEVTGCQSREHCHGCRHKKPGRCARAKKKIQDWLKGGDSDEARETLPVRVKRGVESAISAISRIGKGSTNNQSAVKALTHDSYEAAK